MFGLIQVKQGCIVLDISGMFSKCFAGGIEVVRVRHCLRNFTPPKKENKKIILRLFFLHPSSSLSLYYSSMNLCAYGLWPFR